MSQRIEFSGAIHEFPDNFTDADIAKALGGPASDPRGPITRGYQDYFAKPLTRALSPLADQLTEPAVTTARLAQGEAPGQVAGSLLNPTGLGRVTGAGAHLTNPLAEAAVPQTPLEAGLVLGTFGAGQIASRLPASVAALARAHPALTRVFGGALGGEAGNQLEGGPAGLGALVGGPGAAGGEVFGAGAARVRQMLPGGKAAANRADTQRIAEALGGISPALADTLLPGGRATAATVQATAEGAGRKAIGAAKEQAVRDIEGRLTGQSGTYLPPGQIEVPSLSTSQRVGVSHASPTREVTQPVLEGAGVRISPEGPPPPLQVAGISIGPDTEQIVGRGLYGEPIYGSLPSASVSPPPPQSPRIGPGLYGEGPPVNLPTATPILGRVINRPTGERSFVGDAATHVAADVPITATKRDFTLREANAQLSDIGAKAFSKNPLDRTAAGVDQRQLYGQVARDITSGIERAAGPEVAGTWTKAQTDYAQASKVLDFLKRSGVVDNDGFLNVGKMQRMLNQPKTAAALEGSLGPDKFKTFVDAIYRGAPRGEVDRVTSGMGGPLDALMQVLRGTNTGASQMIRVPIATVLPGVGGKYVGRAPLALPAPLQGIIDVGAQRGAERMMR